MSWAAPLVLGTIPLAVLFVWWLFRPQRGAVSASYANIRRLWADRRGLTDSPAARRRRTRGTLLGLAAALALCALARPQWGKIEETSYDQSREVLLALDLSRSMLADDVSPTRLERAKLLIDSLLDQLRGERVGLVVFAGTSFLQSPLSADYEVLRDFLEELDPTYLPQGGTEYAAMLKTAVNAFGQQGEGDRFLVVLSDGEAQDAEWKSYLPALKEKGIKVIGLGVGTAAGALVPDGNGGATKDENGAAVLSKLEPATLQELASSTGGTYRDASTWVDIAEVVQATVDQGRLGQYVEHKETRLQDRFQWFLAPALLFFLLSFWLELPIVPVPHTIKQRHKSLAPVRAAATALMIVALALPVLSQAALPAAPPQSEPPAAPPASVLGDLVDKLSASSAPLAAGDYAQLASTTIEVASKPDSLHGPARLGVIDDALRGVDEGEQLDAKAADWPKLREELQRLKEEAQQKDAKEEQDKDAKQDQQQQQQTGEQAKNDEQKNSQPGSNGEPQQDQQQAGGGGKEKKDDQQANAGEQKQEEQQQEEQAAGGGEEKKDERQADAGEQKKEEPKPLHDDNAGFGKLDEPKQDEKKDESKTKVAKQDEEKKNETQPPKPGTRLVGGGPVQQQPKDGESLALVEAQDRMDRIKDGDSPATLFDRMSRAEGGAPQPKKNTKNW